MIEFKKFTFDEFFNINEVEDDDFGFDLAEITDEEFKKFLDGKL